MLTLLLILIIIASILLILIILAQNPKGGGLSGTFGAGASQILGARQSADFMEKATWYFGIGILVVVTATYFLTVSPTTEGIQKSKVSNATDYAPPVAPTQPGQNKQMPGTQMPQGNQQQAPAPGNQK